MAEQIEQPQQQRTQPKREKEKSQILADYLSGEAVRKRLADVCTKSLRPEELIRLMLLAASRQPDLLLCTQHSILRALMDSAQLGIAPMGLQGRGYLVPRNNSRTKEKEACFDPGWRGLCDIARRGGLVSAIDAKVVYQGDDFSYRETEEGPKLIHDPLFVMPDEDDADEQMGHIIAAYARAKVQGAVQLEVLRRSDINRIMASSASQNGPWSNWFDEMARKSAVKRLCKYLPYSPDLDFAVRVADRSDGVVHDGDERDAAKATDLGERIRGRAPAARQLGPRSASAEDALFGSQPMREREQVAREEPRQEVRQEAQQQRREAPSPTATSSRPTPPSSPPSEPQQHPAAPAPLSPRAEQYRRAFEAIDNADSFAELWGLVQADVKVGKVTRDEYDALTIAAASTERRLGVGGPR